MENKEQQNNLIKILVVIGIIVFVSTSIFDKNEKNTIKTIYGNNISEEKYLELSKQCKIDAQKNLEGDINEATTEKQKSDVRDCFYLPPVYSFNKELNTCLYYGGYTCDLKKVSQDGIFKGLPSVRWSKHITDVYTNKTLKQVYVEDSSNVEEWTKQQIDEFNTEFTRLGLE